MGDLAAARPNAGPACAVRWVPRKRDTNTWPEHDMEKLQLTKAQALSTGQRHRETPTQGLVQRGRPRMEANQPSRGLDSTWVPPLLTALGTEEIAS